MFRATGFGKQTMLLSVLAAAVTCGPALAEPVAWNVPGDFPSIQAAINAGASGDTILVAAGTYRESLNFNSKAITVRSTGGPALTTIQPSSGRCVEMGPTGGLIGFTLTGGKASSGAGVLTHGSGSLIQGNIFDGNSQGAGGYGAGIGGNGSSPIIRQNIFRHNSADGQWTSGVVSFVNTSSPLIENNIFEDNSCRAINFTVPQSSRPIVVNNTIVRNTVGIRDDCRISKPNDTFRNNILVDNGIGLQIDFGSTGSYPMWENNLVFGNATDYSGLPNQTGLRSNISSDPLFISSLTDYRLKFGSPAIDGGSSINAPAVDFAHVPRPYDGNHDGTARFDIGAYEAVPEPCTFALLGVGVISLLGYAWRRRAVRN